MADVNDCIVKLETTGQISKAIADEAREFFKRSKAEYSRDLGPASSDAAAALETAKKMRDKATKNQVVIANAVKVARQHEMRIVDDPRGPNAAVAGMLAKDTLRGDNRLNALRKTQPDHPIFTGPNAYYLHDTLRQNYYSMLGPEMEKLRAGFLNSKEIIRSGKNFISERFGVSSGDDAAKVVSDGFSKVIDAAAKRAEAGGKIFDQRDDWRVFQPWTPSRVSQFTEAEFVKDFRAEMDTGGVKLWDKEANTPAAVGRTDEILKKAYSDIKTEGGQSAPFSKHMRTFEFQPGEAGRDSWLKMQSKYGVGNEILAAVDQHIDHISRDIALLETFGPHPQAQFAADMRLVKSDPTKIMKGLGWADSENTLRKTFDNVSGKGSPVADEFYARVGAASRDIASMGSLRNLPVTIVPSDTVMLFQSMNFLGMSGFDVIPHIFDGTMTKDIAQHLMVSSHGTIDFVANAYRKYENQVNASGLIRKVSRFLVKATGADWWTRNARQSFVVSFLHQINGMRDLSFDKLHPDFRNHFLGAYGFTPADWDKIRAVDPYVAGNGAKYTDLTKIEGPLSERLQMAIREQSSYAFHEPDARTTAILTPHAPAGTLQGEAWKMIGQYKQFALERMTTHMMRALVDGPIENRVTRGAVFAMLGMGAGAVSMQAAAVLSGKDLLDMRDPKFWIHAFARGGAGGVYGDVLGQAFQGNRGAGDLAAQMAGPVPGMAGDFGKLLVSPFRQAMDQSGRPTADTPAHEAVAMGKRWSPNTWYTKLAVDRLMWEKMQVLVDPNYRQSFRRAEQNAKKQGSGFWWGPGSSSPDRVPNPSTSIGR